MAKQEISSALKVLQVLDVLLRNFAYGFTPKELIEATGFSGTDITRFVNTLVKAGFAERIQETGRIRPSHHHARYAVQIMNSLNEANRLTQESLNRITRI